MILISYISSCCKYLDTHYLTFINKKNYKFLRFEFSENEKKKDISQ